MCRMGDVLAGNHAVWEFDSDSVLIRFVRGIRTPRLWNALGERRIPLEALSGVSVEVSGGRRDAVVLRAAPRPGADPLMEAAAGQLKEVCDPYRLTLPGDRAADAEAFADMLRARLGPEAAEPADHFLVGVPQPPPHLKAYDARVGFDGSAVTFHWSRTGASSTKWRAYDQRFALSDLSGVEWVSPSAPASATCACCPGTPPPASGTPAPTTTWPPPSSGSATGPSTNPCRSRRPSSRPCAAAPRWARCPAPAPPRTAACGTWASSTARAC